jgi:hypothetical protein
MDHIAKSSLEYLEFFVVEKSNAILRHQWVLKVHRYAYKDGMDRELERD